METKEKSAAERVKSAVFALSPTCWGPGPHPPFRQIASTPEKKQTFSQVHADGERVRNALAFRGVPLQTNFEM